MSGTPFHTDTELLRRVAQGDEAAFRRLFEQWHPLLAGFIFRITTSRELAQEIVQDVFLKIWMSRETLSEIEHFKSYLLVMSRNHALNALKKTMRQVQQRKAWLDQQPAEAEKETEDVQTLYFSLLDEAIDKLPARQREVYLLHRHERLTYQEIAGKLGIGRETVKTHLELAARFISTYIRSHLVSLLLLAATASKIF